MGQVLYLILCKLAGILQVHVLFAWRGVMGSQRQASQGVPASSPVPDLRQQLFTDGWCQCHPCCSHTQVLAAFNHTLRSTLWDEIDPKEKRQKTTDLK